MPARHDIPLLRTSVIVTLAIMLAPAFAASQASSGEPSIPLGGQVINLTRSVADSTVLLPNQFIAAGSDTVLLDSTRVLKRGVDYSIGYRFGTVRLSKAFVDTMLNRSAESHRVVITYRYFPFTFRDVYAHRTLTILKDSTGHDSLRVAKRASSFNIDDIFGSNLQKSGSIVRGFTVASNRDLTLNSGLRMQLSGRIGSNIDIAAALTDENTPIQPEGTTQTLQEFDNVFVEIKSTDVAATLGDFYLDMPSTEFARLNRKLQGAKGVADYRLGFMNGSAMLSGAVTRGKFNTMQFNGIEGVQGPYLLTGRNGEREIVIVAGTERVYIDGELKTRGETNDYTIDYSTGEITFTPRRLITSASRITVDYEYSDRQYSRSLLAVQNASRFLDNRARLTVTYLREADDPDAPIDLVMSDSVKSALQAAGADRNKAVLSGVTKVDSNGFYMLVDTVLSTGAKVQFYRYAPGDPNALYNVSFSSVGFGNGDYARLQAGVFEYRGPGGGDYLPLRYLPLPQEQQVIDLALDVAPVKDMKVSGEFAQSRFDPNRLSLANVAQSGHAVKLSGAYAPRDVSLFGMDIGGFDLALNERYTNRDFVPLDRTNDIEFTRKWGIDSLAQGDEEIQEASLKYLPTKALTIGGGYGKITRGDRFRSVRDEGQVTLRGDGLPLARYYVEDVRSTDVSGDNASSWLRQHGSIEQTFWKFTPRLFYEGENRSISSLSTSMTAPGSFAYDLFGGGLALKAAGRFSASADFSSRTDDAFANGTVARESRSFTQSYSGKVADWNTFSTALDVTLRKKTYSPQFKELGNADIRTVLVRSQSRYAPFARALDADLLYEVSTERSSQLQRVFVRVAEGTGNYRYLGDLNNNGLADDNEFVLTRFDGDYVAVTVPTDQLVPVIDLKSSLRLRFTPARLFPGAPTGFGKILSILSGETYMRVDEKSTERDLKQIYLLHFSHFQNDTTTITGQQVFTQDLYFFEGQQAFSARLRFSQQNGLNNFSDGAERSYVRERSVRLRWQLVNEISNQIDYVNRVDRLGAATVSSRMRDILSNDVTFDLSYRPRQEIEFGLKAEVSQGTDHLPVPAVTADLNSQSVRFVYAFQGAGQTRVEVTRDEITMPRAPATFPFELTGGRVVGKTWVWRMAFDYRITSFLQASMNYDGRIEGGGSPVHTARGEVKAFF
jgi:hypothetical protein